MNCTPSGVSTVQFAVEVTRYDTGLCFKIFNFSISSILMSVLLVSMYDAITGFHFLLRFVGREIIILDTSSAFIFSPRGLSHCCGKQVDEGSAGISLYPEIFHCSSALTRAKTCAHCPDTLIFVFEILYADIL